LQIRSSNFSELIAMAYLTYLIFGILFAYLLYADWKDAAQNRDTKNFPSQDKTLAAQRAA
jgi:hypothetical protein